MGWIKRADRHDCILPRVDFGDGNREGDVWKCDECGQRWMLTDIVPFRGAIWKQVKWWEL